MNEEILKNLKQNLVYLETPWQLSCDLLPPNYINSIVSDLDETLKNYILNNYNYKENSLHHLKTFIDWHEKSNKIKLYEADSYLLNILNAQ